MTLRFRTATRWIFGIIVGRKKLDEGNSQRPFESDWHSTTLVGVVPVFAVLTDWEQSPLFENPWETMQNKWMYKCDDEHHIWKAKPQTSSYAGVGHLRFTALYFKLSRWWRLICGAFFSAFFPMEFRAKERLLTVYCFVSWSCYFEQLETEIQNIKFSHPEQQLHQCWHSFQVQSWQKNVKNVWNN